MKKIEHWDEIEPLPAEPTGAPAEPEPEPEAERWKGACAREGMAPITRGFADAWALLGGWHKDNGRVYAGGEAPAPEEFRAALGVVGIGDAKGLAAALGLTDRQARTIMAKPQRLLWRHVRALVRLCDRQEAETRAFAWSMEETIRYEEARGAAAPEGFDPASAGDGWGTFVSMDPREALDAAQERLAEIADACALFTNGKREGDARKAVRAELEQRFLVEAWGCLSEGRRRELVDVAQGLLLADGTPEAQRVYACMARGAIRDPEDALTRLIANYRREDIDAYLCGAWVEWVPNDDAECFTKVDMGAAEAAQMVLGEYVGNGRA